MTRVIKFNTYTFDDQTKLFHDRTEEEGIKKKEKDGNFFQERITFVKTDGTKSVDTMGGGDKEKVKAGRKMRRKLRVNEEGR